MYEIINVSVTFISPDKLKNPYSSLITPKYLSFMYMFACGINSPVLPSTTYPDIVFLFLLLIIIYWDIFFSQSKEVFFNTEFIASSFEQFLQSALIMISLTN